MCALNIYFKAFFKHSYYSYCGLKMVSGSPYTVIERLLWFVIWGSLYYSLDTACFSFPIYQSWKQWLTALELTLGLALLLSSWMASKPVDMENRPSSEQHSKSAQSPTLWHINCLVIELCYRLWLHSEKKKCNVKVIYILASLKSILL